MKEWRSSVLLTTTEPCPVVSDHNRSAKMMRVCEKCGSQEFESRWKGLSYEFRCAKCRWGEVTTHIPPILADQGPYRIVITSLGSDPNRSLIALNRRFSHGILHTRSLFPAGEREFFCGPASEVLSEAQALRSAQVPFRIEAEFPYDFDIGIHHAHEHDWQRVTTQEAPNKKPQTIRTFDPNV